MDTFLPKTAIDYPILLKKALAPGDYRAVVRLVTPGSAGVLAKTMTVSRPFSVSQQDVTQVFTSTAPTQAPPSTSGSSSSGTSIPWGLIGLVAIGALAIVSLIWLLLWLKRTASPEERAIRRSASASAAVELAEQDAAAEHVAITPPERAEAPLPPEPEPESEPEPEAPRAAPLLPVPPVPLAPPASATCDHLWEVAYDRGQLGGDGVWRFPHQCATCGLELFAADITDATRQAQAAHSV